jgi:disulfide bond formation protein DsbB
VTEQVQTISALLALVAAGIAVAVAASWLPMRGGVLGALRLGFAEVGVALATAVATGATVGSLYFSEAANYVPCNLCWYQRIAMYATAVIGAVAVVRRDRGIAPYMFTLSAIGTAVSTYHYVLEWNPQLETEVCSLEVPCTTIWFREFGFVTLPFMATCGFVAIMALTITVMRTGSARRVDMDR